MKRILFQTIFVFAIASLVISCKKDDDKPVPGDGGNGGGITELPGNSLTATFDRENSTSYENSITVSMASLPNDLGDIHVNDAKFERSSIIPGIIPGAYESDSELVGNVDWIKGKTVNWSISGKDDVPPFSVNNERWPTVDFSAQPKDNVEVSVTNGFTISFDKNVRAEYVTIRIRSGLNTASHSLSNFNGQNIDVPGSAVSSMSGNDVSYNVNVYAFGESSTTTVSGKTVTAVNHYVSETFTFSAVN